MPTTPAAAAARCSSNCTPSSRGSLLHAPAVLAFSCCNIPRSSSRGRVVAAAAPNCRQQQAVVAAAVLDALCISTPSDLASSSKQTDFSPNTTPDPALWLESELSSSTNHLGVYEIPDLASAQAHNSQAPRGRQFGGASADQPARSSPRPSSSSRSSSGSQWAAAGDEQRGAVVTGMMLLNSKAVPLLRKRNRSARPSTRQQRFTQRNYPQMMEVSRCCCIAERASIGPPALTLLVVLYMPVCFQQQSAADKQ